MYRKVFDDSNPSNAEVRRTSAKHWLDSVCSIVSSNPVTRTKQTEDPVRVLCLFADAVDSNPLGYDFLAERHQMPTGRHLILDSLESSHSDRRIVERRSSFLRTADLNPINSRTPSAYCCFARKNPCLLVKNAHFRGIA